LLELDARTMTLGARRRDALDARFAVDGRRDNACDALALADMTTDGDARA